MVPHKKNSKVWPGLVTKEKTMKYPASAMCTVSVLAAVPLRACLFVRDTVCAFTKGYSLKNVD